MRVYLDHNATTPLRPEARAAMVAAMDVVGNPSSVHAEGRSAKAIVEKARRQVADLIGGEPGQVVFTSGATEVSAILVETLSAPLVSAVEHDAFFHHHTDIEGEIWPVDSNGLLTKLPDHIGTMVGRGLTNSVIIQSANSETGVMQKFPLEYKPAFVDATQSVGKVPFSIYETGAAFGCFSAHKFGGPKGVGAFFVTSGEHVDTLSRGGGQEMGRRSGTENVIGIAGFGAAAEAAKRDVEAGAWDRVAKLRNILENALEGPENETIFVGKGAPRLPNTSCILTPGWKGETQVMQMDLAGFAISAGSACSSGKVKASRVLRAMGYNEDEAASAIRVSLGLETTEDDVLRFAEAWRAARDKHSARVA